MPTRLAISLRVSPKTLAALQALGPDWRTTLGEWIDQAVPELRAQQARAARVAALEAAALKICPICDQTFSSATARQIYCSSGNRRCMKYAQRYGVEHGRRMYAAKHPPPR